MQAHKRGKGLSIEFAINIFGVALAYWVDYGFSFIQNDAQFRFPLALQILFAIVTFLPSLKSTEMCSSTLIEHHTFVYFGDFNDSILRYQR